MHVPVWLVVVAAWLGLLCGNAFLHALGLIPAWHCVLKYALAQSVACGVIWFGLWLNRRDS